MDNETTSTADEKAAFLAAAAKIAPRADLAASADGEGFADAATQALWAVWSERARMPFPIPEGFALVPKKASDALLMSMAMRVDHGLGVPGHYDAMAAFAPPGMPPMPSHEGRLRVAISDMRKAHEEVVGEGFHHPEREDFHLNALNQGLKMPSPAAQ